LEADGRARSAVIQPFFGKVAANGFGKIIPVSGPRSPSLQVQDLEKPNRAAVAPIWRLRLAQSPPSFQPGCGRCCCRGCSRHEPRRGRDGWPSMGTLGANDPGRPRSGGHGQAEVVSLAVGNYGDGLSWSVAARHW